MSLNPDDGPLFTMHQFCDEYRLPRDHASQLHVLLDKSPIESWEHEDVIWYHAEQGCYVIGKRIFDLLSEYQGYREDREKAQGNLLAPNYDHRIISVIGTLRTHLLKRLPSLLVEEFITDLFTGEMAQMYYIDNRGGKIYVPANCSQSNKCLHQFGASSTAFLGNHVKSAALLTAKSIQRWYALETTQLFWHWTRYDGDSPPIGTPEYFVRRMSERNYGLQDAQEFEQWLCTRVRLDLVERAVSCFRAGASYEDHEFTVCGEGMARWWAAKLFSDELRPTQVHCNLTGMDLEPSDARGRIQRFVDRLERLMDEPHTYKIAA